MPIHNDDITKILDNITDLLEIRGKNAFRIRAYRNASREVLGLPKELAQMIESGADLTELPAIGEALAAKIGGDRPDRDLPGADEAAARASSRPHRAAAPAGSRTQAGPRSPL